MKKQHGPEPGTSGKNTRIIYKGGIRNPVKRSPTVKRNYWEIVNRGIERGLCGDYLVRDENGKLGGKKRSFTGATRKIRNREPQN